MLDKRQLSWIRRGLTLLFLLQVSFFGSVGVALSQWAPLPVQGQGEIVEEANFGGISFPPPTRIELQFVETAKKCIETGNYRDGVRYLNELISHETDNFYTPDYINRVTQRSLKAEAKRMLKLLPPEGIEVYRQLYEPKARYLLRKAVKENDTGQLSLVASQYQHTKAGWEANYILALDYLDAGEPRQAITKLKAISDSYGSDALEPTLSLTTAMAQVLAGENERALLLVEKLRKTHKQVTIASQVQPIPPTDQTVAWLRKNVGVLLGGVDPATHWTMLHGSPARDAFTEPVVPLLSKRWSIPIFSDKGVEGGYFDRVFDYTEFLIEHRKLTIPALHPVISGDTLLMRTAENLIAVNIDTGARKWKTPLASTLGTIDKNTNILPPTPKYEYRNGRRVPVVSDANDKGRILRGVFNRIVKDGTFGNLTCDDKLVYAIEDMPLVEYSHTSPYVQRVGFGAMVRGNDAQRDSHSANRLAAYHIDTGKLAWHVGGNFLDWRLPLAGTFFMGPPLPLSGKLYVIGRQGSDVKLFCVDRKQGKLLWEQTLAITPSGAMQQWQQFSGISPSYASGILVCPTTAGAIVAVDPSDQSLIWGYRFFSTLSNGPRSRAWAIQQRSSYSSTKSSNLFWSDSSCLIIGDKIVTFPEESNQFHCIDLRTGDLFWNYTPTAKPLFFKAVGNNRILICYSDGRYECLSVNECYVTRYKKEKTTTYPRAGGRTSRPTTQVKEIILEQYRIDADGVKIFADGTKQTQLEAEKAAAEAEAKAKAEAEAAAKKAAEKAKEDEEKSATAPVQETEEKDKEEEKKEDETRKPIVEVSYFSKRKPEPAKWNGKFVDEADATIADLPSGYGFATREAFFLPLSSSRIARIDLKTGELTFPARSRNKDVLGNLLALNGRVFSQTFTTLTRYDGIGIVEKEAKDFLAKDPQHPAGHLRKGELLLSKDQLDAAIDEFEQAYNNDKKINDGQTVAGHARRLLIASMFESLESNFAGKAQLLEKMEPLLISVLEHRRFKRDRAQTYSALGRYDEALADYFALLDEEDAPIIRLSRKHHVSLNRWVSAEMQTMFAKAGAESEIGKKMQNVVGKKIDDLAQIGNINKLRSQLTTFDQHPSLEEVRLVAGRRLFKAGKVNEAELLLLANLLVPQTSLYGRSDASETADFNDPQWIETVQIFKQLLLPPGKEGRYDEMASFIDFLGRYNLQEAKDASEKMKAHLLASFQALQQKWAKLPVGASSANLNKKPSQPYPPPQNVPMQPGGAVPLPNNRPGYTQAKSTVKKGGKYVSLAVLRDIFGNDLDIRRLATKDLQRVVDQQMLRILAGKGGFGKWQKHCKLTMTSGNKTYQPYNSHSEQTIRVAGNANVFLQSATFRYNASSNSGVFSINYPNGDVSSYNLKTLTGVHLAPQRHYTENRVYILGHLLAVNIGDLLTVIDTTQPVDSGILWSRNLLNEDPHVKTYTLSSIMQQTNLLTSPYSRSSSAGRSAAAAGAIASFTPSQLVFRQCHYLVAVCPLSGEVLWVNSEGKKLDNLFGDDNYIFAMNASTYSNSSAQTYSARTGQLFDSKQLPKCSRMSSVSNPLQSSGSSATATLNGIDQMGMVGVGRELLIWSNDTVKPARVLTLCDPITGKNIWEPRRFEPKAKSRFFDGNKIAVLEPSGKLTCLSVLTGETLFEYTYPDFPGDELIAIKVYPQNGNYYMVAMTKQQWLPDEKRISGDFYSMRYGCTSMPIADSHWFAFDHKGKPIWEKPARIRRTFLLEDTSNDVPVFIFFSLFNHRSVGTNRHGQKYDYRITALDKRTGEIVVDKTKMDSRATPYLFYTINQPKNSFSIFCGRTEYRIDFTATSSPTDAKSNFDKPAETKPVPPNPFGKAAPAAKPVPAPVGVDPFGGAAPAAKPVPAPAGADPFGGGAAPAPVMPPVAGTEGTGNPFR